MMDDADLAELRMLRARAYGPSADIGSDPVALQRLNELESSARSRTEQTAAAAPATVAALGVAAHQGTAPAPGVAAHLGTAPAPGTAATPGAEAHRGPPHHPGPPPPLPPDLRAPHTPAVRPARLDEPVVTIAGGRAAASPTRTRVAPRRWHLSRGFAVLWLVSLVAVAAIASGVGFTAAWIPPVPRGGAGHQIATLEPDPGFVWPSGWPQDQDATGFTFHGMAVLAGGTGLFSSSAQGACLFAYSTEAISDEGNIDGPAFSGCGAGAFPAAVQFVVDDSLPQDLRDTVGEGTALQFVLDGDRLGVFADDSAASAGARSATD